MFSYLESLTDDNLQKYAPRALKGMTNTGTEFIVRALPVATFESGITQRTVVAEFDTTDAAKVARTSDAY